MRFKCGKCDNIFDVSGIKESVVTCSKCGSKNSIRESSEPDDWDADYRNNEDGDSDSDSEEKTAGTSKYEVRLFGGSIGEGRAKRPKDVVGKEAPIKNELFTTVEDARVKKVRMNKLLSPGEKSYYGLKYCILQIDNGIYTAEVK